MTKEPAFFIVRKHEDATNTSSDERKGREELQDDNLEVNNEAIRAMIVELVATTMNAEQDPDDNFTEARIKRAEVEAMGQPMTGRRQGHHPSTIFARVREHQVNGVP